MYSRFFTGLLLFAFQLARFDCAPGREYLSMDAALEGKHNGKHKVLYDFKYQDKNIFIVFI